MLALVDQIEARVQSSLDARYAFWEGLAQNDLIVNCENDVETKKYLKQITDDLQKSVSQIMEVTDNVITSVENLSNCSEQIIAFINSTVLTDYEKQMATGVQYSNDASQVNDLVTELSAVSEEMTAMITNIARSIKEISCVIDESATGATNIAKSSSEISKQTEHIELLAKNTLESTTRLKSAIEVFQLS